MIRAVPAGAPLLGDYGDGYWEAQAHAGPVDTAAEPCRSALMRRLVAALRGSAASLPIEIEVEDEDEVGEDASTRGESEGEAVMDSRRAPTS